MAKMFKPKALNSREIQSIYRYLDAHKVEYTRGSSHAELAKRIYNFVQPNGPALGEGGVPLKRMFLRAFHDSLPWGFKVPPPVAIKPKKQIKVKPVKLKPCAVRRAERQAFYESDAWRAVRYDALRKSRGVCELCGTAPVPGKPLHVDHIKPRSLYPLLELDINNLQVLCVDCNLGKSNRDQIDWRRDKAS